MRKKKVALVNPPNQYMLPSNTPAFLSKKEGVGALPPLGLLFIASYLKKNSDHELLFLDGVVDKLDHQTIAQRIVDFKADVVGITTITFFLVDCIQVAKAIKKLEPSIKVVMGGPHVAIYPEETAKLGCCDFVLKGECEQSFTQLVNHIEDEEEIKKINGIYFKTKNGTFFSNPHVDFVQDLDSLPFPDRSLIPYKKYNSILSQEKLGGGYVTTIFSSRGCPFKCIFCDRPTLGKNFRFHSPEYVLSEIQHAYSLGVREFFFYDDTFTINRERVMKLCQLILANNLKIIFDIRTRVNNVDEELLTVMKRAGLGRVHYGIEAGSEEILKKLKKGITKSLARKALKATKNLGIECLGYFMFGAPSETKKQMLETVAFAKELSPDYCHFAVLTPFPGTPIYLEMVQNNLTADYWKAYAENPTPNFVPPFYPAGLSREELIIILSRAYKKFYMTPKYILKQLIKIRTPGMLWKRMRVFFNLFFTKTKKLIALDPENTSFEKATPMEGFFQ